MAPRVETVSVAEFGKQWGVTPERVYQWIQVGMPHRKRENETDIVPKEANRWKLERAVAEATAGSDEKAHAARLKKAEADLREADARERLGLSIPRDEWQSFLDKLFSGFSAVTMGQLQRFEREIVRCTSAGEARLLTQKMQVALMEGAQKVGDRLEIEASEIDVDDEQRRAGS